MIKNEIRKLYYYEIYVRGEDYEKNKSQEKVRPFLTFDKKFAKKQNGFRVGDLATLNYLACYEEWFKDEIFKIQEGFYEYYEVWDKNMFDEGILISVGYRKVES